MKGFLFPHWFLLFVNLAWRNVSNLTAVKQRTCALRGVWSLHSRDRNPYCLVRCNKVETSEPLGPASAVSVVFTIQSSYVIENRTKSTNCWCQKTDCNFPTSLYCENHYCSGCFRDVCAQWGIRSVKPTVIVGCQPFDFYRTRVIALLLVWLDYSLILFVCWCICRYQKPAIYGECFFFFISPFHRTDL